MATPAAPFGYFACDFFTPFYFPPLQMAPLPGTQPGRYFAPAFFSPFYFAPLLPNYADSPDEPEGPYRDGNAFAAVIAALEATEQFGAVVFGTTADCRPVGADLTPVAVITPDRWSESDDADPSVVLRQVVFSLTLIVREEDSASGFDQLDRLTCLAQNAIEGSDLGGGSLKTLTRVRSGNYDAEAPYPEKRVVLHGEFSYLIPSPNSHFTST
jgi:hypothetical protein